MFILERFFVLARFPEFQVEEGEYCERNFESLWFQAGIEFTETRLSSDTCLQAVRIYYGTKNVIETARQLQFEYGATSELQLFHSFHGIFSHIINSDGLNSFV